MKITSIEQSKTLSKILPLESADAYYSDLGNEEFYIDYQCPCTLLKNEVPAWSLNALLDALDVDLTKYTVQLWKSQEFWMCELIEYGIGTIIATKATDKLDACVEAVIAAREAKLL